MLPRFRTLPSYITRSFTRRFPNTLYNQLLAHLHGSNGYSFFPPQISLKFNSSCCRYQYFVIFMQCSILLFTHLPIDTHIECFPVRGYFEYSHYEHSCMMFCRHTFSFFLGIYLGLEWLGHSFNFIRNFQTFSQMVITFYTAANNVTSSYSAIFHH